MLILYTLFFLGLFSCQNKLWIFIQIEVKLFPDNYWSPFVVVLHHMRMSPTACLKYIFIYTYEQMWSALPKRVHIWGAAKYNSLNNFIKYLRNKVNAHSQAQKGI